MAVEKGSLITAATINGWLSTLNSNTKMDTKVTADDLNGSISSAKMNTTLTAIETLKKKRLTQYATWSNFKESVSSSETLKADDINAWSNIVDEMIALNANCSYAGVSYFDASTDATNSTCTTTFQFTNSDYTCATCTTIYWFCAQVGNPNQGTTYSTEAACSNCGHGDRDYTCATCTTFFCGTYYCGTYATNSTVAYSPDVYFGTKNNFAVIPSGSEVSNSNSAAPANTDI